MTVEERETKGAGQTGPIVYDPSAWTGSGADWVDPLTRKEFRQSRVLAAGRVLLQGTFFCMAVFIVFHFYLRAARNFLGR